MKDLYALEIHDVSLWEPSRVLPAIDVMERWGYNALVLHQNDLLDWCTQLGLTANYGVTDLRLKKVRSAAGWMNRLVDRLAQFDARLFLEIKEPSFHDYALELFPELLGADGQPDPTGQVWPAFCRAKTEDLLRRVPGLGGLVVNLSSPESRVSLPDFLAEAEGHLDRKAWFAQMVEAFHGPLQGAGKDLYVRDFSYTAEMQSDVLGAVDGFGGAVGASVKATAHDYFPEYPENPVARSVTAPVILEFEAFGEHMGWGVIPNCRVEELRGRMAGYREMGAQGFLMRVSWEAITGASALDSLSAVNVFALPRLVHKDEDGLIEAWLLDAFGLGGELARQAAELMRQSWAIPAAAYWQGRVFPRHSCLPSSWQEGWLSMMSNGMGRRDRDLSISPEEPLLTDAAGSRFFDEKSRAVALAERLALQAADLRPALPAPLADLFCAFDWLPGFARQFDLASRATFHAARQDPASVEPLRLALLQLADELRQKLAESELPHPGRVLFDPAQIELFAASLPALDANP